MLARHRSLDDGALHRSAGGHGRFGAEVVEVEPAPEFRAGVVHLSAPSAVGRRAGVVAQLGEQLARLGKLVSYPGRHHRVSAGHGQPGQHVGQGPAMFARARDDGPAPRGASPPREQTIDGVTRLAAGWPRQGAQRPEQPIERRVVAAARRQPVPGEQQIGINLAECGALVFEERQREPGVVLWIVAPFADEIAILVVLDQVVVRILRERERTQHERVQGRTAEQSKIRCRGAQVRQVEVDQVVAEDDLRRFGEVVEFAQGIAELSTPELGANEGAAVRVDGGQGVDSLGSLADLQIDGEIAHQDSRGSSLPAPHIRFRLYEHRVDYPRLGCTATVGEWRITRTHVFVSHCFILKKHKSCFTCGPGWGTLVVFPASCEGVCNGTRYMATQAERTTALEVHYEHVDKRLTVMSGTLDAVRAEVTEVRAEVAELRVNLTDEIAGVRTMVHKEIAGVRAHLDDRLDRIDERFDRTDERFDRIQKAITDDRVQRSETKLRVALRVIGWLAGVVTTVLGAVVGGLFVFARFLLPRLEKLAFLAQDTGPLVG